MSNDGWLILGVVDEINYFQERVDEFNKLAPYGLEHRRERSFSFQLAEDHLKEVVSVLSGEDAKQITYRRVDRLLKPWPAID